MRPPLPRWGGRKSGLAGIFSNRDDFDSRREPPTEIGRCKIMSDEVARLTHELQRYRRLDAPLMDPLTKARIYEAINDLEARIKELAAPSRDGEA